MNRRLAIAVITSWVSLPVGSIATLWAWDVRYVLTGAVLAFVGLFVGLIATEADKRTAERKAVEARKAAVQLTDLTTAFDKADLAARLRSALPADDATVVSLFRPSPGGTSA